MRKFFDGIDLVFIYTSLVSVVGLVVLYYSLAHLPSDRVGLFVFASMACLAELARVELFLSSRFSSVSVSGMIGVAGIVIFGPFAGVIIQSASGVTTAITTSLSHESPQSNRASWTRRFLFNLGMYVVSTAMAGVVYYQINNSILGILWLSNGLAIIGAAATDAFVNIAILIGVISLQSKRNPTQIWQQDFQWTVPITVIGYAAGGGILALAYKQFGILGAVIFLLPILATSYAFRVYKNNMKVYVEALEKKNADLKDFNIELLDTLSSVVDAYDAYTYGHSRQVAAYAQGIAEIMGLEQEMQAKLVMATLIHDIGKVGIRDEIISKPGPLTEEERQVIRRHPIIGAEIIGRMKGLADLVPIVRSHHERWDGNGYPDGLMKEEIPLEARILSVADTLDVILSDRPYRKTHTLREAKEELLRCSGTQFDPRVVDALMTLAATKEAAFFRNSAAITDHTVKIRETSPTIPRFLKKAMVDDPQG